MVKPKTVMLLLFMALSNSWVIRQLDVHNAFLNGYLSEMVYMHKPPGYANKTFSDHVFML